MSAFTNLYRDVPRWELELEDLREQVHATSDKPLFAPRRKPYRTPYYLNPLPTHPRWKP